MIILGIDPGSRITGFGVIQIEQTTRTARYLDSGVIRVKAELVPERLLEIYEGLREVIHKHQVTTAAIEQIFMHFNAQSALKLGQARGAALVALASFNLPVSEYSARQIKQSVVGYGAAEKTQVQEMVKTMLKLNKVPSQDAADALACALCHYHTSQSLIGILGVSKIVRGRVQ